MKRHLLYSLLIICFSLSINPAYSQTFNELETKYKKAQKDKDYDEVIEILTNMLKKYPDNQPEVSYFNRGNAYRYIREYKKAVADYTKVIKIKPGYTDAFYNRGVCFFRLEEFEKAVSDFTEVIKIVPDYPNVYFNRANSYSCKFNYDSAVVDYTKAIELNPDFADAYYNRGNKYYDMSMYKEAIEDWKIVIKLDPAYKSALQNKIDEAKEQLDKKK
jgi:tetratricopeptide (TPR) repeat protein